MFFLEISKTCLNLNFYLIATFSFGVDLVILTTFNCIKDIDRCNLTNWQYRTFSFGIFITSCNSNIWVNSLWQNLLTRLLSYTVVSSFSEYFKKKYIYLNYRDLIIVISLYKIEIYTMTYTMIVYRNFIISKWILNVL